VFISSTAREIGHICIHLTEKHVLLNRTFINSCSCDLTFSSNASILSIFELFEDSTVTRIPQMILLQLSFSTDNHAVAFSSYSNETVPDTRTVRLSPRQNKRRRCKFRKTITCSKTSKYRTIDGSCNNLAHPYWGKAGTPLIRFVCSAYDDSKYRAHACVRISHHIHLPSTHTITLKDTHTQIHTYKLMHDKSPFTKIN
jgi:hypothetical protein